ncbi:hypothetical protein [Haloarcula laminariae]|uniref:hypothetical protein n=1 Tax=Haloarcula laminariae TaxID=2961577 RepID=UPI0021C9F46E|nr:MULTISPECIES: hypothetical protein [Halomicroarcula]
MSENNAGFSINTASEVFLILATGVAVLYGFVLVVGIFSTGLGSGAVGLGIALILLVQAAQSLHTITE